MTPADLVTEVEATAIPECTEREVPWPWHELEYQLLVADSDRILADALTPQAVVLLKRVTTGDAGPLHPSPPTTRSWSVPAAPVREIRAKQRSPPKHRTAGSLHGTGTTRLVRAGSRKG